MKLLSILSRIMIFPAILFVLCWARADTSHTVMAGETLSSIAERYFGNVGAYRSIAEANSIPEPFTVKVGMKLRIPAPSDSKITAPMGKTPRRDTNSPVVPPRTPRTPSTIFTPPTSPPSPPRMETVTFDIEEQELVLINVIGTVRKIKAGAVDTLVQGTKIRAGDSIRTSSYSHALLSGMNGERLALGPSTTAVIQELSATYSDRRMVVRVDDGQIDFSVPEIPFFSRYLFETPTGSISTRYGSLRLVVRAPEFTSVSIFDGKAQAHVPMGTVDIDAGKGTVLRTMESPPAPQPLPPRPGLSVETSATMLIIAGAGRPGQSISFDIFTDGNCQQLFASKTVPTDATGVALTRVDLPNKAGAATTYASLLYWVRARAVDGNGLSGEAAFAGPVIPERD